MRRNDDFSLARWQPERGVAREDFWSNPTTVFTASPWQMMRRMQEDMDRIFSQFLGQQGGFGGALAQAGQQWTPNVDISQTDREWLIEADLPGVKRDDIDIQVQNHYLVLRAEMRQEEPQGAQGQQVGAQGQGQQGQRQQEGAESQGRQYHARERRYGYLERILPLPDNVDEENVSCEFRDGVLTIHIPKMEQAGTRGRRIPIGEGSQQLSGQATGTQGAIGAGSTSGASSASAETSGGSTRGNGQTGARQPATSGRKGGQTGTAKRGGKSA